MLSLPTGSPSSCIFPMPFGTGNSSRSGSYDTSREWKSSKLTDGRKSAEPPLSPLGLFGCEKLKRGFLAADGWPKIISPAEGGLYVGRSLSEDIEALVTLQTSAIRHVSWIRILTNLFEFSNGRGPSRLVLFWSNVERRRTCEAGLLSEEGGAAVALVVNGRLSPVSTRGR